MRFLKITIYLIPTLLLALVLFGCASLKAEPTPTATATQTPVPPTATPTLPPTDTPTPTLEPTPEQPQISFPPDFPCLIVFSQFATAGMDIFVADCNSEEFDVYRLTEHAGIALWPYPSPNLLNIAYTYYDPVTDQNNLWVIDLSIEGNPYNGITIERNTGEDISWSSDSRYVIYSAPQPDGAEKDIYRVEIETGTVVNLTASSPVWDAHPQFSPVGDEIVFVSDRHEGGKLLDNIWMMDSSGGNLRQLTNTETWENSYPSWSPDGTQIAFYRWGVLGDESEAHPGLIVLDLESGEETVLAKDVGIASRETPIWSPDGQYIAYLQSALEDASQIMVVPTGGGDSIQITDLSGKNYGISWSLDSQWIIFTNETSTKVQIYIVDRNGSGLRPLFPGDGNAFGKWFQLPRD